MNLNKRKDAKTPRRQEDRNCPATRTKPCLPCLLKIFAPSRLLPFAFLLLCAPALPAQSLRFYASPYRVYKGDAVRFVYLDRTNGVPVPGVIPRANILPPEPSELPRGFGVRWLAGNGADTAFA